MNWSLLLSHSVAGNNFQVAINKVCSIQFFFLRIEHKVKTGSVTSCWCHDLQQKICNNKQVLGKCKLLLNILTKVHYTI
jgi:hypothetical protein